MSSSSTRAEIHNLANRIEELRSAIAKLTEAINDLAHEIRVKS